MRLSVEGLTWAAGLLWGGLMLFCGALNLLFPGYADAFLEWAASFYPGYDGPDGPVSVLVVTLYGLVDGAVAGLLFGWLYNLFATEAEEPAPAGERRMAA